MMALHSVQPMTLGGAPPLGDQRRRTIPRGAQFCSIYLQNHINKCCRIVQLLKSKAARWGGGCKRMTDHCRNGDAISKLQPGNHCIWEGAGGMESMTYFLFPTDITDVVHWIFYHLDFNSGRTWSLCPSLHIIKLIILQQWQIETVYFVLKRRDSIPNKKKIKKKNANIAETNSFEFSSLVLGAPGGRSGWIMRKPAPISGPLTCIPFIAPN